VVINAIVNGWSRFHTTYTGTGVGHKLQRLTPSTRYTLRIAASSESGQGAWSDLLTCETLPVGPSPPLDLVMRQEGDVIMMSWEEVGHSLSVTYELQLKIGRQDFTQVSMEQEWVNGFRTFRCFLKRVNVMRIIIMGRIRNGGMRFSL
jgi:hypothetical protein